MLCKYKNFILLCQWFDFLQYLSNISSTNSKELCLIKALFFWVEATSIYWMETLPQIWLSSSSGLFFWVKIKLEKNVCFYLMQKIKSRNLHHPGCSDRSTHKTVGVQGAFTSGCTLYVTAVPGARPKTATVTLRCAHHLSHWETKESRLNRGHQHAHVCVCLCVCVVVFGSLWSLGNGLDTHRSDTGPCLGPSSNLHRICDMDLRDGERSKLLKQIEETILKFGDV